ALHLRAPERYAPDDEVPLAALPGVAYRYDEARQTVDIAVADAGLLPHNYDLHSVTGPLPVLPSATGAALNYLLFAGGGANSLNANWGIQGLTATLDAHIFSPYGVLSQTGILAGGVANHNVLSELRLDTTWTYEDPGHAMTYRAGDTISSGFAWTRPIR